MSSVPATRMDVISLEEQLNTRLKQRQARETGICPIRRELYSQCFGKATCTTTDFAKLSTAYEWSFMIYN